MLAALWADDDEGHSRFYDYFSSLPEDVQRGINEHANEIHSAEELRDMAELLTQKQ